WSYDENGWPSGFAGGELLKDKANFALAIEQKTGAYPESMEDIIAVYRKNADGTFIYVTADCGEDEYLILYKRYDESYVDTLDGEITDKFIAATHEEYKKRVPAGEFSADGAMPGFFTDEPQYYRWGNPWSNTLPAEFGKAYGYSIFDKLPAVFFDFDGADKFRYDYYYLIHKLFISNWVKKVYDWCLANGVSLTGHAVEESSLGGQMMCIGGCMPFYEYETIPGVDYLGRGVQDDISFKQLGSACAQLGKKKALSEMFACCGWDVSPNELKRIADVQYAGGVNLMCQHLYPYSERGQRKRDYPLHYSEHNPWQSELADFNNYYNNLGAALAQGQEYAPVLVIHPIHGAYCRYKKNTDSLGEIEGKFFELSRFLGQNQIPYHYGDEWMMERMASVENGRITVGQCTYDTVVVPFTYSLDENTVSLLETLRDQGGRIILFDTVPAYIAGNPACGRLDWLKDCGKRESLLDCRDAVITKDGKNIPELRKMTRLLDGGERLVYITNISGREFDNVRVSLPEGNWAELDMHTLEYKPLALSRDEDRTTACMIFRDSESHVLVCGEDVPAMTAKTAPLPDKFIPVPNTVRLTEKPVNVITLDTAALSTDGVNYDEPLSVYGIKDNLLRQRYDGVVSMKFTFNLDYTPSTLKAVLEPMYQRVTVNGTEIIPDNADWWFDKSFASAEIAHLTKPGINEIIVEVNHHQRDYVYYVLYGGVSESLRNCLVFDVEIEPMYLIGDFAVRCSGIFSDGPRFSTLYDGTFDLVAQPAVVPARDVVRGGFPFYGGKLATAFDYDYAEGKPTVLALTGRFATAEVSVNGTPAGKIMWNRTLDLAAYLKEGKNEISVTMCNSMRNAMGPHHRRDPEPYGVGPGTFSFEKEWNGRECRGYTDRYAFVKFGLKK
ncbi:MAG: hypothetical protein IJF78_08435, partial [Clostridia bacterium]|nr:hypothetical protein [Clostridia bacterium]